MNQYRCDNGCKYFEQHYCNFLHDRLANIEIVHIERVGCASHSDFQSERDKVLELLRLKYVEFLNHPCPELADKYDHCCDAEWCGLCTLDEVLAELRQKTGEQIPSRPQQEHQLNKDCLSCQHPTCPQRGTTSNAYFVCNDRQNQGRLTMNHKRCCETCLNVPCKILDRVLCINQSDRDKVPERLHIWFENYCEGNEDPDLWMAFLHAERTLRQAGEQ